MKTSYCGLHSLTGLSRLTSLTSSLTTLFLIHSLCPSPFLLFEPAMPLPALGNMYLLKDVVIVMI